MAVPELTVDLAKPPRERWTGLAAYRRGARELMSHYVAELGAAVSLRGLLEEYRESFVQPEYIEELRSVAEILDMPELDVLLANLYYDALKVVLGCTAFAVETARGILHARNLD